MESRSRSGAENFDTTTDLPVVFQCQNCNTILSDSLAFEAANDDTKTITVNRVTSSVEALAKLVTSTDGIDQGSTYSPLVCRSCEVVAGRVYRTTPRILDHLRDTFTFDVGKLSIYQVGSTDVSFSIEQIGDVVSGPTLKELKETTLKMQVLICTMHQRIINIEQSLEIEEGEPPETPLSELLTSNTAMKGTPQSMPKGTRKIGAPESEPDRRDGDMRAISSFPQSKQRGKRISHLTADTPHSSDAESSGSEASSSRGSRRRNSSILRSSKGRGVSGATRGAEGVSGATSNRKRAVVQEEDGDTSSDLSRGLEKMSPIKKKVNARSRKS